MWMRLLILAVERKVKEEEIQKIARKERRNCVFIDCHKLGGSSMGSFFNELSSACESICSTRRYKSTLYHHEMYHLLEERKENMLTLYT